MKNSAAVPQKVKPRIVVWPTNSIYDPAVLLLDIYLKELKVNVHTKTCTGCS